MKFSTRLSCVLTFFFVSITFCSFGQVSGTVFRDYNGNGAKDANEPLVTGVTVNAYLANTTTPCGTVTTSGNTAPNYTLSGCGAAPVRVEFVLPSSGNCVQAGIDFASFVGSANKTSIQFVNGDSPNVDFAIHNPNDYNEGTTGVNVYIPMYISGDPLVAGTAASRDWFVGFPYTNSGPTGTATGAGIPHSQKVNGAIIGSTWGVAYSKQAKKVFTSALLKRHVGLGTLGSGGIYMLEPTATSFNVTEFYDMDDNGHQTRADASAPAYGENSSYSIASNSIITYLGSIDPLTGQPSGLGVVGTNADRGLTSNPVTPGYDPAMFDQVGKVGIGDIEISDDGKYLFVMNLYSRKVFRLELDNAFNPTSVIAVTSFDVPATTCTNGAYRPWALKFFRNKLYVGVVCSAENAGTNADLTASVYELNNPTAAATFNSTALITLPLDYNKPDDYNPWTRNSADVSSGADRYATPILSDIEFTDNGDMVLGIMDRSGHQWGEQNYRSLKTTTETSTISTSGDILAAGYNCGTGAFTLENNGTLTSASGSVLTGTNTLADEGPGGKEFYNDNSVAGDPHKESATGALAVLKGQGAVMSSAFAMNKNSGDAGAMTLSTTDGSFLNYNQIYYRSNPSGVLAKANGLGDIELSGVEAPIEIGNRIWKDTNNDGIQDAGEDGVDGVEIELYAGTTVAGSPLQTVTSATVNGQKGTWSFSNLNSNQDYTIKVKTALGAGALAGCTSFSPISAGTTLIDNNTSSGTITLKTGNAGENNHSYDIGVSAAAPSCNITVLSATPSTCDPNTNTYTLTIELSYSNAPSGDITINGQTFTPNGTGAEGFTLTNLTANGAQDINVVAAFISDPACSHTFSNYDAPQSCSVTPCPPSSNEICPGDTYQLDAGAGLTTIQWFKDNVAIPGANSQTYLVTEVGSYYFTANLSSTGCNAQGCCPSIFVAGNCATPCPPKVCLPVTVTRN